jgi:predicted DNA binding CopG/RHH family protein
MEDEDIDLSDCPEVTPEQFAKAIVRRVKEVEEKNEPISIKFHPRVLAWAKEEAKKRGVDYQAIINEALLEKIG